MLPFFYPRIADLGDKLSGFANLKSTVDRGSADKFGPDSGLCMSRSSDYGLDHQFSVYLVRYFGVLSTALFSLSSFYVTQCCFRTTTRDRSIGSFPSPLCNVGFRQA